MHFISQKVKIPVYAQHVDGVGYGGFTGQVTAASLKAAGAAGSLINHSERRLKLAEIEASLVACRSFGLLRHSLHQQRGHNTSCRCPGAGLRGGRAAGADRQRNSCLQGRSGSGSRIGGGCEENSSPGGRALRRGNNPRRGLRARWSWARRGSCWLPGSSRQKTSARPWKNW